MVSEIVCKVLGWFYNRRDSFQQAVPDCFLFTTDYHMEFREDSEDREQVVPHGLKQKLYLNNSATDNLGGTEQGRRPHHEKHPSFLDLTSVIPDCKIYLEYGRKYFKATKIKRVDSLCDFISNEIIDYVTLEELVYGLSSVNEENRKGMIPYIENACSGKLRPEIMPQLMPNDAKNLTRTKVEKVCNDNYNAETAVCHGHLLQGVTMIFQANRLQKSPKREIFLFSGDTSSSLQLHVVAGATSREEASARLYASLVNSVQHLSDEHRKIFQVGFLVHLSHCQGAVVMYEDVDGTDNQRRQANAGKGYLFVESDRVLQVGIDGVSNVVRKVFDRAADDKALPLNFKFEDIEDFVLPQLPELDFLRDIRHLSHSGGKVSVFRGDLGSGRKAIVEVCNSSDQLQNAVREVWMMVKLKDLQGDGIPRLHAARFMDAGLGWVTVMQDKDRENLRPYLSVAKTLLSAMHKANVIRGRVEEPTLLFPQKVAKSCG
ncbi:hypothetical protein SELMODRAFT_422682 [Selaginella moellendorffii]|uniref:Uncharacterized protein n=1 Tax=Selaginella moellendorffii TaxID=88036 RepID=D8SJ73_SELML|nr:hypothetical protein SELMODRAFT_422682 [Selaginella moellendorffii]